MKRTIFTIIAISFFLYSFSQQLERVEPMFWWAGMKSPIVSYWQKGKINTDGYECYLPMVIFPDNHDMSRFYVQVGEDIDLLKMGIAFFLTTRGIPQIYYGTEILMRHERDNHGNIRADLSAPTKELIYLKLKFQPNRL